MKQPGGDKNHSRVRSMMSKDKLWQYLTSVKNFLYIFFRKLQNLVRSAAYLLLLLVVSLYLLGGGGKLHRGGVVYTRWGSNSCPSVPGTLLVYAGRATGTHYTHKGGGANHLCLPSDPQYTLKHIDGDRKHAYLWGSEYQSPILGQHDLNVACAVCLAETRETMLMIPAQTDCPTSWTREYYGYLMTEHHNHHRSTFECIDKSQEPIPGNHGNQDGALFYHVEVNCNGIDCPPYNPSKELNCVVCTK